jgi:hypothetical protein
MRTTNNQLNRFVAVVLAVAVVASLGVGGSFAAVHDDGDAQVRIAHLSPDAPAVDVLVDGEAVLEGAEFGDVSDYLNLSAGEHNVTIQTSEDESVVFQDNVSVEAGTAYTIAAIGEVSQDTFEARVFEDDFETPGDENATVRLIHASPDAPDVDVTVADSDTVLFDNVTFGNATDYAEVPAGDYGLEVRPATADDDGEVVTTVNVTLEGGTVFSAIAAGYLSPGEAAADVPFEVLLVTDAGGEMMMGNETTEEMMGSETTTEM